MATWKTQPNMLGIRMAFNAGKTRQWLEDGTADWFWEAAERYDVPVMAFAPAAGAQARRDCRAPSAACA